MVRNLEKRERKERKEVLGVTLIAWNFEEARFRRILKGCVAVRYAM